MKIARMVCVLLSFAVLTLFAENSLPEGYTRLEWIESSGIQYIATGYTPSSTDKVTIRFQFLDASFADYQALYCARNSSGKQTYTCMILKASKFRIDYNTGTCCTTGAQLSKADHLLVVDGGAQSYFLDGSDLNVTKQSTDFDVGSSFYLFCSQSNTLPGKFRLYYFKVEDASGNVKVDMRPCCNASGVVGLYDFAEGRAGFYGNSGEGEFVGSGTELPPEYVACDWIDSSGTQWLNTEVRPICLDKVETKVRFHDTLSGEFSAVFCARVSGGKQTFTCVKNNTNFFRFDRRDGTGDDGVSATKPAAHVDYLIEMDADTRDCKINGEFALKSDGAPVKCGTTGGFVVGSPFVLFAGHDGTIGEGHMSMSSKLRFYSFKVQDPNGAVISDLKPCRRVADDKVGVYDIINKKFLTNDGTGVLTAPRQTLPSGYTQKEWVRSTGTQYLDTGYWPSQYDTMYAKFSFSNLTFGDYQAIYCARKSGKQTFTCQLEKSGGKLRFDYNDATRGRSGAISARTDYEVEVDGETQTYKLNGETISGIEKKDGAFTVGSSVHLFGSELGVNLACLKMYSYKAISKDGVTMCNCVPCVRNADDVVGMYDLANDRFLENQGAGKFGVSGLGVILVVR